MLPEISDSRNLPAPLSFPAESDLVIRPALADSQSPRISDPEGDDRSLPAREPTVLPLRTADSKE